MGTFDEDDPMLFVGGLGQVDCRDMDNLALLAATFGDKQAVIEDGRAAAASDIETDAKPKNPHSKIFSPLKWTAWNSAYWFIRKHHAN